jgi:hypothetical protein
MRSALRIGGLLVLAALALGACGGSDKTAEPPASDEAKAACEGTALSGDPKLPAKFPKPAQATYVSSEPTGPSQIVDGYYDGSIKDAHDDYMQSLQAAGFDILFDEVEAHDSEVSWKGGSRTGQVALREDCGKDGRIYLHITSRPE